MNRLLRATQRTVKTRLGSLVVRPKLVFVFGFFGTTIAVLVFLSWFHRDQVDEARSAQATLNQIAVLTREINNLTLTALQNQNLTPKADAEMREARHALAGSRVRRYGRAPSKILSCDVARVSRT